MREIMAVQGMRFIRRGKRGSYRHYRKTIFHCRASYVRLRIRSRVYRLVSLEAITGREPRRGGRVECGSMILALLIKLGIVKRKKNRKRGWK